MKPANAHNLRNGLSGIYTERRRLLSAMLNVAESLDKRWPLMPKRLRYKLSNSLVEQMSCIKRMDGHLDRMLKGLADEIKIF